MKLRIGSIGIILSITTLLCCQKEQKASNKESDLVILQTLDSALNLATYDALDSALLGHFDFFPDTLRFLSSARLNLALKSDSVMSNEERELTQSLVQKILDSVNFAFEEPYVFKHNKIINATGVKSIIKQKGYFGSLNLSDPVVSKEKNLACYYFALNCIPPRPDGCTFSCAVYCIKKNDRWKVNYVLLLFSWE